MPDGNHSARNRFADRGNFNFDAHQCRTVCAKQAGGRTERLTLRCGSSFTRSIFSAEPTLGEPRISSKPPLVNSSTRDEAKSARNKLLGVMMMSGLTKLRFIWRRRT